MWGYSLDDLRVVLAQWDKNLSDLDLAPCAQNGVIYLKSLAEIQTALLQAGYYVDENSTPLAWQQCKDLLVDGVAAYFVESRRSASYTDGYDPVQGLFSRYRRRLKEIANGGRLGELGGQPVKIAGVYQKNILTSHFKGL